MRLSIIQPSHYRSKTDRSLLKIRKRRLIGLTLPYLAALTPRDWDVRLIDEQLEDVDFDAPVDLAAVTTWTINSFRAYEIADTFRRRGVSVIMGGPHTYFVPGGIGRALRRGRHRRGGDDLAVDARRLRKGTPQEALPCAPYAGPVGPADAALRPPRSIQIRYDKDLLHSGLAGLPL